MPELFSFFPAFKDAASEHVKAKFGSREAFNPTSYHESKARAAVYYQNLGTLADFLEGRWGSEPILSGPFKGEKIDKENFDHLLSEWYWLRGWNRETGIPTKNTLEVLNLGHIADELKVRGKLE
jgi:aldehyde:ferredoxin oxidoreductase